MTKAGWEWWRCAGEVPAGQRCHISAWPEAGSKVPGAAGNVAGLNPMGSTGQWGGLDPRAGSCLRPSLGCCCLLKALAGDGGVRRLDKALPRQHFLRWALFVIAGAPCALPGDGGCHPWCFPSYWPVLIPLPAAAGAGGTGSPLPPLGEQDGLHGVEFVLIPGLPANGHGPLHLCQPLCVSGGCWSAWQEAGPTSACPLAMLAGKQH